jgi:hypothetical protein
MMKMIIVLTGRDKRIGQASNKRTPNEYLQAVQRRALPRHPRRRHLPPTPPTRPRLSSTSSSVRKPHIFCDANSY